MNLYNIYTEGALVKAERDKLPDSEFGLEKERQFPLIDEEHVRKAIQLFRKCPEDKKSKLAEKIFSKATKFDIKISKDSAVYKYLPSSKQKFIDDNKQNLNEGLIMSGFLDFQKIPITDENIQNYAWSCPDLLLLQNNNENRSGVIVVDKSSTVVGFIQVDIENHSIQNVFVNPYYRNQGIASQLLADMMYQYEINNVSLFNENTNAINFFKKNGFTKINETKNQVLMELASVSGVANIATLGQPTITNRYRSMFDYEEFFETEESLFTDL